MAQGYCVKCKEKREMKNEEEVEMREILVSLEDKISNLNEKTVIIKADEKIDLGLAVKVMDIAKQANASGLVISTKQMKRD